MSFPYEDMKSSVSYACSNGPNGFSDGAIFIFTDTPWLSNEEFDFESGERIVESRVKWDDASRP